MRTAEELWAACERDEKARAEAMPTEKDAMIAMLEAYLRLTELGWRDASYCPKDGTPFQAIEPGCSAAGKCTYDGEWPKGRWWMHEAGDLWPSRPCLWRPLEQDKPE